MQNQFALRMAASSDGGVGFHYQNGFWVCSYTTAPSTGPLELRRFLNAFCFNHLLPALISDSLFSYFVFSPGAANGLRGGGAVLRGSGGRLLQADSGRSPLPVHGGGPRLGGAQHQQQLPRTHLVGSGARRLFSSRLKNVLYQKWPTFVTCIHCIDCDATMEEFVLCASYLHRGRTLPASPRDYLVLVFV